MEKIIIPVVLVVLIVMNVAAFVVTGLFGGLGGVLGMQLLRHKTKHTKFVIGFPLLLAAQVILLAAGAMLLL